MAINRNSGSEAEMARRTRRAFMVLGGGAAAGLGGLAFLNRGGADGDIPAALRGVLGFNERVVRSALYSNGHLTRTYPASSIGKLKVNGTIGMDEDEDLSGWRLNVLSFGKPKQPTQVTIDQIRTLPRHEETIDFKCVEGWSTVVQFAGARLSDFTAKFAPGSEQAECVGMKTPDEEYYVSVDMASAMHPQTLLAWEMNGQPLTGKHGAPLRLLIPVKYGIKNIKRIGTIEYTNTRPDDYWAERGYDWYAGL